MSTNIPSAQASPPRPQIDPLPAAPASNSKARFASNEKVISQLRNAFYYLMKEVEALREQNPVLAKQQKDRIAELGDALVNEDVRRFVQLFRELPEQLAHAKRRLDHVEGVANLALSEAQRALRGSTRAKNAVAHLERRMRAIESLGLNPERTRAALEAGQANGRKAFQRYVLSHGVSQEQLRQFFGLISLSEGDELDFTDEELFYELLTTVMAGQAETDRRLNTLDTRVDGHEQRLNELSTRVETIETTVKSFGDRAKDSFPFLIGGAVMLIVGLFIWLYDRMPGTPWYNELGLAAFIGAIVGIIASFIGSDNKQVEKVKHIREERRNAPSKDESLLDAAKRGYREGKEKAKKSKSTTTSVNATEGSDNPKGSKPEGAPEPSDASKTPEPARASS